MLRPNNLGSTNPATCHAWCFRYWLEWSHLQIGLHDEGGAENYENVKDGIKRPEWSTPLAAMLCARQFIILTR